jgi:hypothetical protein
MEQAIPEEARPVKLNALPVAVPAVSSSSATAGQGAHTNQLEMRPCRPDLPN